MSIAYRILTDYAEARIECEGQIYGLEDLCEAIWHLNIELQGCYLTKREQTKARKQIKQYDTLLSALNAFHACGFEPHKESGA